MVSVFNKLSGVRAQLWPGRTGVCCMYLNACQSLGGRMHQRTDQSISVRRYGLLLQLPVICTKRHGEALQPEQEFQDRAAVVPHIPDKLTA